MHTHVYKYSCINNIFIEIQNNPIRITKKVKPLCDMVVKACLHHTVQIEHSICMYVKKKHNIEELNYECHDY